MVPSLTRSKISGPALSTTRTPASTRSSGPRLGYRPEIIGAALTTASDAGVDERLGGLPVHVEVVDDGDVALAQAPQEAGRAPVQPGRTVDSGE